MRIIIEIEGKETEVKEIPFKSPKYRDEIMVYVERMEREIANFGQPNGYLSSDSLLNYIKIQLNNIRSIVEKK